MLLVMRIVLTLIGLGGGFYGGVLLLNALSLSLQVGLRIAILAIIAILGGMLGFLLAKPMTKGLVRSTKIADSKLQKMPLQELIGGAIGLIIGLIIATFIGYSVARIPWVGTYIAILICIVLGYLGFNVGIRKNTELLNLPSILKRERQRANKAKGVCPEEDGVLCNRPKVLDTSAIIDGRIADICMTGFVEGPLVIPNFVLEELRHIADSSDSLKRIRGRRGLDVLQKIRSEIDIEVRIVQEDYPEIAEVDDKLLRLAQDLCGCVVTNDYNLNKVASVQGVAVLNINELANAIKTVLIPGEEMRLSIIKEGKEANQGVGYLDDGTMIVVENGKRYVNEEINITVTSVIQTNAGRMIFAKPSN